MTLISPVLPADVSTEVNTDEIFAAHEGGKLRIELARPVVAVRPSAPERSENVALRV